MFVRIEQINHRLRDYNTVGHIHRGYANATVYKHKDAEQWCAVVSYGQFEAEFPSGDSAGPRCLIRPPTDAEVEGLFAAIAQPTYILTAVYIDCLSSLASGVVPAPPHSGRLDGQP